MYIFFVNIIDPVLNKTNDSPLHDKEKLLECKAATLSIVITLNKIVITEYVYN